MSDLDQAHTKIPLLQSFFSFLAAKEYCHCTACSVAREKANSSVCSIYCVTTKGQNTAAGKKLIDLFSLDVSPFVSLFCYFTICGRKSIFRGTTSDCFAAAVLLE
jgi:hypothetical protein